MPAKRSPSPDVPRPTAARQPPSPSTDESARVPGSGGGRSDVAGSGNTLGDGRTAGGREGVSRRKKLLDR
jgi:hypothetical protein